MYENKQPSLYLNGAFIKTGLTSPRVSVFPSCQFGNVSSYGPFQGLLDEVSIYSRVLSAAEIQGIYGAGGAGKCKPPQPSEVIYAADFETNPGPEWSHTGISVTPRGGRHFLGRFGSQTVTLTVSNLPPHANLTATFDVFVIQSWDGNNGGPDIWEVGVAGGPMLLHTTFQNWGSLRQQAYPNNFPGGSYRGRIGALEAATLGYSDWDAVYRLSFTFPHASNVLQLSFRGANLEGVDDESWGLDNLTVYADGPSIAFASPTNDAAFSTPTNLTLAVNALATGADLRCVQYFNNRVLLGTVTESPYTLVWSNAPAGHHIVTARVTDLAGKTAEAHCALRINGLMGEYFDNMNFMGTPARRLDPIVAFDWDGAIPIAGVSPTYFTARWTGEIEPLGSGPHTFYVTGDDRFRLWVDGVRIVDDWTDKSTSMRWGRSSLSSGRRYSIQLDYAQGAPSGADVWLEMSSPVQYGWIVNPSQLFPPEPGKNRPPNRPVIISPAADGWALNQLTNPFLAIDFFSDPDTGQTQEAAEWEIWLTAPSERVWYSLTTDITLFRTNALSNGSFAGSHAGLQRLLPDADYLLRVRHRDDSGTPNAWGGWGERHFTTRCVTLAGSSFDSGLEGWDYQKGAIPSRPPEEFEWQSAGNPGGCLFSDEYGTGDDDATWYRAPATFLGNKSGAYGGYLEFDMRWTTISATARGALAMLQSPTGTLHLWTTVTPSLDWAQFRLPLWPDAWDNGRGVPSELEFLSTLSTLTNVLIRADDFAPGSADNSYLDNVRLVAPMAVTNRFIR